MSITPEAIEAEHREAVESLTRDQQRALSRVQRASQMAHFNHRRIVENLQQVFEEEAQRRNATHSELAEKATD
ncbi:MAG: hypothetical protein ACYDD1_16720 [Caulobacteraceae bacterium]